MFLLLSGLSTPAAGDDWGDLRTPGTHAVTLNSGGHVRSVTCVTPPAITDGKPLPLVFVLHGAGGTGAGAIKVYGWGAKAAAEGFIAVAPQGLPVRPDGIGSFLLNPNIWRDGRSRISDDGVDDIAFFDELLTQVENTLPVDTHRVYVTGFSNGAGMTFTLGGRFADRIAAIAPVASQSFAPPDSLPRAVPVYYLVGTADPLVPFLGGESTLPWGHTKRTTPPIQQTVDTWVHLDGCPTVPQLVRDEGGVRVERYAPGRDGVEILFTVVAGNGHHWPGSREPLPHSIVGPTLDPFNATDAIWDFLSKWRLP